MFENIIFRQAMRSEDQLDLGAIAEALLFYRQVHLFADQRILRQLVDGMGIDNIVELIDEGSLLLSFLTDLPAIETRTKGNTQTYKPILTSLVGHQGRGEYSPDELFDRALNGKTNVLKIHEDDQAQLIKRVPHEKLINCAFGNSNPFNAFVDELKNREYGSPIAISTILHTAPYIQLPPNLYFRWLRERDDYRIDSNIPFSKLSELTGGKVTESKILSSAFEAYCDTVLASFHVSELATGALTSSLFSNRIHNIQEKRERNSRQISSFQQMTIGGSFAIRECINSREQSFHDFMPILRKSRSFRSWLQASNPSIDLVTEYLTRTAEQTWLTKLPAKSARFLIATGVGVGIEAAIPGGLGMAVGIGASALDNFLLDRILGGWKPGQFVQGPLKKFVT
ncbi:hypothetical protein A8950_2061 [Dongia mobilis]|uniref:Uncharacterized protein n=1 Tax=Dongia mobilis TaxID=578943 RepID=A0A4R6WMJ8_9PROT|nr:hypothetical protein [Dongia mobilis]TDQ82239.1 hypothetical protein A8950_2061 [Dongia mobilis]